MSGAIRVLVADDHPVVRQGLVMMLTHQEGLAPAGEASSGREAIERYGAVRPDVALIDLRMNGDDGVLAIQEIRGADPDARIVVLTSHEGDEDMYRALRAGAMGYLLKGTTMTEIVDAIRRVHRGQRHIPADIADKLSARLVGEPLTGREDSVLKLIAEGRTNQEIAEALHISEATVKYHVSNVLAKLGVPDRTKAAIVALERGIAHLTGR